MTTPARTSTTEALTTSGAPPARPAPFDVSPAIGPLPAIAVPSTPADAPVAGLLWQGTVRAARWVAHHLTTRVATVSPDQTDRGEPLTQLGKGSKVALVPLPPAVGRAIDRAIGDRKCGPILLNRRTHRMDRHCATRWLLRLAEASVVRLPRMHPHMLRHTFVTTSFDAGVDLSDVQIAARHADPRTTMRYDRTRKNLDRHLNYILAAYMASGT